MASPDFIFHVGDRLPVLTLSASRQGSAVDLTGLSSANVYIRKYGASANSIAGSCVSQAPASAGVLQFAVSAASVGSAGFTEPGIYSGQLWLSYAAGEETSEEFTVEVRKSYRNA